LNAWFGLYCGDDQNFISLKKNRLIISAIQWFKENHSFPHSPENTYCSFWNGNVLVYAKIVRVRLNVNFIIDIKIDYAYDIEAKRIIEEDKMYPNEEEQRVLKVLEEFAENSNLVSEGCRKVILQKIMRVFYHDPSCNYIVNEGMNCTCGHWEDN